MPVDLGNIEDVFTYHAPKGTQPNQLILVREAAKNFARVILENTRPCADQQAAIRLVREAAMTANAAVVLEGKV